ncbi:MAG TPA: HigA family addiction module antitoxin [Bacteroidia bacterium]|jgi:addiction module HigA family antidote|nr:HigA family addiction module antitoxin [Bacteroidia bacterium]
MNKYKKNHKLTDDMIPGQAFHPGVLLFDEIEYRGISQKELADSINIAPTVLSEIIHGKRNLTAALALKLEKALDIDAITWMRLQVKYDIDSLRIKERDKGKHIAIPYQVRTVHRVAREPKSTYKTRKGK